MVVTIDLQLFDLSDFGFPEKMILNEFKAMKEGSSVLLGSNSSAKGCSF